EVCWTGIRNLYRDGRWCLATSQREMAVQETKCIAVRIHREDVDGSEPVRGDVDGRTDLGVGLRVGCDLPKRRGIEPAARYRRGIPVHLIGDAQRDGSGADRNGDQLALQRNPVVERQDRS